MTPSAPTPVRDGVAVSLRSVSKTYRLGDGSTLTAADGIDLDLGAGRFTAVVGPSGSGKSTLLHLIGAIDEPDSGTITVGEQEVTSLGRRALADYRSTIGFVFQQFHLIPALTLLDNVIAPLVGRRVAFDRHERARELLEAVGLGDRHASLPSQLSGGQQQRVAIARALVAGPGLLLADEPTGNLDSHTAGEILALLANLQRTHGTTVVMATHDPSVADRADRVVAIRDGRLDPAPA
ncbi:ABC transporter ATP-binding protein [Oryzihumus leptocrescens]|uniref:Putative ABC transport system ATP-binding protein n=1 Tax=Oryzihumus leptocrescens TaxID=297536 RepID=A0A542Z980_9MICO|nr:ABC transporter ATP-binding protein [Oryzihumus leptocrescens]TQL56894.1 putative ABC transport system ATP-binding protein [Oryzihumus leptocrescens]